MLLRIVFLLSVLAPALIKAQPEARLLRFPTISQQSIVFTYAGDLYEVNRNGGLARKLTSDVGNELFARFSPDGKTIAFSGQYDGNTEVYTMPAQGGVPTRLTYTPTLGRDDVSDRMGPNNLVMTWRPDGSGIVYRSRGFSFNDFKGRIYEVNPSGGPSVEWPLSVGSWSSFSPDQSKIAMNQIFREFRTWKYYRGGMADDIWIYDVKTKSMENITNHEAQDIFPMWHGQKIFFCSDRDRTMNIFEYDVQTKSIRKVTNFTEFDVKFPSLGGDAIVYENGGYIYVYDIRTGNNAKVSITIADDAVTGRNEWVDASKYIEPGDFELSPDGNRITFVGRGDVWTIPAKEGITRNLTHSSSSHERSAVWSPNGKYIAYISDATGEDEIYIQVQDGSEPAMQLTSGGDTYKFYLTWSPDSKQLAWTDKKLRLQTIDVATKKVTLVDKAKRWEHGQVNWSPDSRWITFSKQDDDNMSKVYLYDTQSAKLTQVTDEWYEAYSPAFSSDGKYLLFTSDRDFNPTYSRTEWNHSYGDMSKVYVVLLSAATPSPFAPKNDEVAIKKDEEKPTEMKDDSSDRKKGKKDEDKKVSETAKTESKVAETKIDLEGLTDRIVALPVSAGNYFSVSGVGDVVYYMTSSSRSPRAMLKAYNLKDKKENEIGEFSSYRISADNKKMLLLKDGNYFVIDLPKDKANPDKKSDLSNMKVLVDRKAEWKQIYNESWRQMRDFFYDPNMHGVQWAAMKSKYESLVPHVNHRHDLSYIIGELIGELNVGHAYVGGGDAPKSERISLGLLGAKLSRDASGYYKINEILKGENWKSSTRSPLTEPGVNVKAGEFIISINGVSVLKTNDIYELLVNTANKITDIEVNSVASPNGSRHVLVVPTDDESDLYYLNWVRKNIEYVSQKTNGQVGYLHIPDMGVGGLNEFVKYFYPQLDKKALIIDDRGNGGGNVSPMITERLRREPAFYTLARNVEVPTADPENVVGPKVLLLDQYSASDGDIFPFRFRHYKLGKLIGRRSWGGVVGIRGSLPFIDGGTLNRPEFARYTVDGTNWPMESYGVDPDIVVYNNPADEYMGKDDQLDKAIEVILEELKSRPETPAPPPYPVRNK